MGSIAGSSRQLVAWFRRGAFQPNIGWALKSCADNSFHHVEWSTSPAAKFINLIYRTGRSSNENEPSSPFLLLRPDLFAQNGVQSVVSPTWCVRRVCAAVFIIQLVVESPQLSFLIIVGFRSWSCFLAKRATSPGPEVMPMAWEAQRIAGR